MAKPPEPGLFGDAAPPQPRARSAPPKAVARGGVAPASDGPLAGAPDLPGEIRLGTSSWSFPGWKGIVWAGEHAEAALSRSGLAAYSAHRLFRTVSLDRTFYAPIDRTTYARYAAQTPDGFRFMVKAPAAVADPAIRAEGGRGMARNGAFLDPALATDIFVGPCLEGLGPKAGPLVFQLSPMPGEVHGGPAAFAERISAFFSALPRRHGGVEPIYALELRNAELVTPRLMRALGDAGVRHCLGLHPRMPDAARQAQALRALDGCAADGPYVAAGPLVVRWNLHRGLGYEEARGAYAPFDKLVDEDLPSRAVVARLAVDAWRTGRPVWVAANNKAEGSAPLTILKLAAAIADLIQRESGTSS